MQVLFLGPVHCLLGGVPWPSSDDYPLELHEVLHTNNIRGGDIDSKMNASFRHSIVHTAELLLLTLFFNERHGPFTIVVLVTMRNYTF